MNFKKIRKVFTSKFVGTGSSSYKKRIYRAAVSQSLRNTGVEQLMLNLGSDGAKRSKSRPCRFTLGKISLCPWSIKLARICSGVGRGGEEENFLILSGFEARTEQSVVW